MRFFSFLLALLLVGCSVRPAQRIGVTDDFKPNYSMEENWAALPFRKDMADQVPDEKLLDCQDSAQVDVFFIHPTTYGGDRGHRNWNATTSDTKLNRKTDKTTILHQASIFNGVGRVYAPRYRQAHLHSFYSRGRKELASQALGLAYSDVQRAFEYYLKNYNQGRPIVIASHSQGTSHAVKLLEDFFDGESLQNRLVAAYLVGMPVLKDQFNTIKPCQTPEEIGCFCSWRSYRTGHLPKKLPVSSQIAVTNPLSWNTTDEYVSNKSNRGGVLRNFEAGLYENLADAQVHRGLLWVSRPKFPWSFLLTLKNYHLADYNFFYMNVRENGRLRSKQFLKLQADQ